MSIEIRSIRDGDAQLIARLIRRSFADVAQRFGLDAHNCPKHPSNCTVQWVARDIDRGVAYFLLEADGGPVGCAALERANDAMGYLERLAVVPEARQHGFGGKLLDHVATTARRQGLSKIGIGIIAQQNDLKQWYVRRGFLEGETKTFDHLPFDVTLMTLSLGAQAGADQQRMVPRAQI